MIQTNVHKLNLPEAKDKVIFSIEKYAENFGIIDELLNEEHPTIGSALTSGEMYEISKKFYNSTPTIGEYIGWVNIRSGRYAESWVADKTYNVGDVVVSSNNNGHYYRCTSEGVSSPLEPVFPTVLNDVVDDTYGISSWTPDTSYNVGKIVKPPSGSTTHYYKCIKSGTSDLIEPVWSTNSGSSMVDGNVTWMVLKTVIWKNEGASCEFRPFGKIE